MHLEQACVLSSTEALDSLGIEGYFCRYGVDPEAALFFDLDVFPLPPVCRSGLLKACGHEPSMPSFPALFLTAQDKYHYTEWGRVKGGGMYFLPGAPS